jgi:hypothetical protein
MIVSSPRRPNDDRALKKVDRWRSRRGDTTSAASFRCEGYSNYRELVTLSRRDGFVARLSLVLTRVRRAKASFALQARRRSIRRSQHRLPPDEKIVGSWSADAVHIWQIPKCMGSVLSPMQRSQPIGNRPFNGRSFQYGGIAPLELRHACPSRTVTAGNLGL